MDRILSIACSGLAAGLGVYGILLVVSVGLSADDLASPTLVPPLLFSAAAIACALIGAIVVVVRIEVQGSKLFASALAMFGATISAGSALRIASSELQSSLLGKVTITCWLLCVFIAVRFTLVFPRELPANPSLSRKEYFEGFSELLEDIPFASRLWHLFRGTFGGVFLAEPLPLRLGQAFRRLDGRVPSLFWALGLVVAITVGLAWPLGGLGVYLTALVSWTALILAIEALVLAFVLGGTEERRSVKWLLSSLWIPFLLLSPLAMGIGLLSESNPAVQFTSQLAFGLVPWVFVVIVAYAVFIRGALDPALILRRSTVFSVLALIGFTLFSGVENALSNVVEDVIGLPSFVGGLIAGALVGGLLLPLRTRVESLTAPPSMRENLS